MVIKLDISKLERSTIRIIATETDDESALKQLAQIDDANVVKAVIQNPSTTKETRELIYRIWKNKGDNRWIMRALAKSPLNNITISSMVESIAKCEVYTDTKMCVCLAEQEEASNEELDKLSNYVICVAEDEDFKGAVLCAIAQREGLTEELANKLLNYSSDVAEVVAKTYRGFLRIDFSIGKTE